MVVAPGGEGRILVDLTTVLISGNLQIQRSRPSAGDSGGATPPSAINASREWPAGRFRQDSRLVRYQVRDPAMHTQVVLFS